MTNDLIKKNIIPTKTRMEVNDKLSKCLFNTTQASFNALLLEKRCLTLPENQRGTITSKFKMAFIKGYADTAPLTEYDRAVFAACTSEILANNKYITPSIIFRHITGKDSGCDFKPTKEMKDAILNSVSRLRGLCIDFDMSQVCEKYGYNGGNPMHVKGAILPCVYAEGVTINGQKIEEAVIKFTRVPPLLAVARVKGQIISYNERLLDFSDVKLAAPAVKKNYNTVDTISVKNYVMRRVMEIKSHQDRNKRKGQEPLQKIITFDDIYKKCRLIGTNSHKLMRVRRTIISLFEHLQQENEIKSFAITKKERSTQYHRITFEF